MKAKIIFEAAVEVLGLNRFLCPDLTVSLSGLKRLEAIAHSTRLVRAAIYILTYMYLFEA